MTSKETAPGIIAEELSNTNVTSDCRSRSTSNAEKCAAGVDEAGISLVPLVTDDIPENRNEDLFLFSNRQIYKNLIILSIAFLLIATAQVSIAALQSSLNAKGNVGINTLIINYVFVLFGFLFLSNVVMDIIGLKWAVVLGAIGGVLYVSANVRPIPLLMYITSAFNGMVSTPLWTSQGNYIKRLASHHAHLNHKDVGNVVSFFFGIFYAIVGTCGIWGNLVSYFILHQTNSTQRLNCGIHFDPTSEAPTTTTTSDVTDTVRYVLCGIFIGMSVFSLVFSLALDQIRLAQRQPLSQSLKKSVEVLRSFFQGQHVDQLLLVPITLWSSVANNFLSAQFTRAFITCLVGIRYIGLTFAAGGLCNAISSYIFGGLVKYIGRLGCILIAAALNYGAIFAMYFWEPRNNQIYVLFVITCVWSIADAAWGSQLVAVYTVLYAETDPSAIAKCHLWKGVGAVMTLAYASYVSIETTVFILLAFLTVGILGYGLVETRFRWKTRIEKSKASVDNC